MRPTDSIYHLPCSSLANSEKVCEPVGVCESVLKQLAHPPNLLIVQLRGCHISASQTQLRPLLKCRATLSRRILSVIFGRTKEKMVGTNAGSVVAFMTNKKIVRYIAKVELVREAMGTMLLAIRIERSIALARAAQTASPYPASLRLLYILPKALGWITGRVSIAFTRAVSSQSYHTRLIRKGFVTDRANRRYLVWSHILIVSNTGVAYQ